MSSHGGVPRVGYTQHLNNPFPTNQNMPIPDRERSAAQRPKIYRLVFRSFEGLTGSIPSNAIFDLGDLATTWNLDKNLDTGKRHFNCTVESFRMTADTASPAMLEVYGRDWPAQSESWDSENGSATPLFCVAGGGVTTWQEGAFPSFTLNTVPSGRVRVLIHDPKDQDALLADSSVEWVLVLQLVPVEV